METWRNRPEQDVERVEKGTELSNIEGVVSFQCIRRPEKWNPNSLEGANSGLYGHVVTYESSRVLHEKFHSVYISVTSSKTLSRYMMSLNSRGIGDRDTLREGLGTPIERHASH